MHDSSEPFKLSLATTDRDTRASLSLPGSNYSEFMIALKFARLRDKPHEDKLVPLLLSQISYHGL